jgi:hypothetical protein
MYIAPSLEASFFEIVVFPTPGVPVTIITELIGVTSFYNYKIISSQSFYKLYGNRVSKSLGISISKMI